MTPFWLKTKNSIKETSTKCCWKVSDIYFWSKPNMQQDAYRTLNLKLFRYSLCQLNIVSIKHLRKASKLLKTSIYWRLKETDTSLFLQKILNKIFGNCKEMKHNWKSPEHFDICFCLFWLLLPNINFCRGDQTLTCVPTQFCNVPMIFLFPKIANFRSFSNSYAKFNKRDIKTQFTCSESNFSGNTVICQKNYGRNCGYYKKTSHIKTGMQHPYEQHHAILYTKDKDQKKKPIRKALTNSNHYKKHS